MAGIVHFTTSTTMSQKENEAGDDRVVSSARAGRRDRRVRGADPPPGSALMSRTRAFASSSKRLETPHAL